MDMRYRSTLDTHQPHVGHTIDPSVKLPFAEELLLLHEANHRIVNEFTFIMSVVSVIAKRSQNEEVKAALASVAKPVQPLVDMHRALQIPEHDACTDAAAYLRRLCLSISRSKLDHLKTRLVLAAAPLQLQSNDCCRLGMIVYELITNAAKHAFPNGGGEIRVQLFRAGAFVECRVLDDGSAGPTIQPGRGLKIVRELARTLAGSVRHEFGTGGSRSILIFPRRSDPREE
ncbi:sensor histidine kinase [Bradyrhizobium sp. ARR65]|uniref:sensor histidine kinase n=1 Tax=Bradyrhizobium sp. ARR65 TaxID=1040989 RepID=UPI0004666E3B|nr:sensor histidine kinase [Bradyrhizobium sp. ARR65]